MFWGSELLGEFLGLRDRGGVAETLLNRSHPDLGLGTGVLVVELQHALRETDHRPRDAVAIGVVEGGDLRELDLRFAQGAFLEQRLGQAETSAVEQGRVVLAVANLTLEEGLRGSRATGSQLAEAVAEAGLRGGGSEVGARGILLCFPPKLGLRCDLSYAVYVYAIDAAAQPG